MTAELLALGTVFLLMVVQVVVPPIPAELVVIVAAREHGIAVTTMVAGSGLLVGSLLVYHLSRLLQGRLDPLFRKERVRLVVARLRRWATPILWIRVLPYNPSDVISYAAGLIGVRPRRYYAITVCTSIVRCLTLAWLGVHVQDLRTTFHVLGLLALSSLVAWALLYRHGDRREDRQEAFQKDRQNDRQGGSEP